MHVLVFLEGSLTRAGVHTERSVSRGCLEEDVSAVYGTSAVSVFHRTGLWRQLHINTPQSLYLTCMMIL